MEDPQLRMLELSAQGFYCSQILLSVGLEAQGKENPDLIRAMSGLIGGIGFTMNVCGALTGGACLLGLYAGMGTAEEMDTGLLREMVKEFSDWFSAEDSPSHGKTICGDIIDHDFANRKGRCPQIVTAVYEKANSILRSHGFAVPETTE